MPCTTKAVDKFIDSKILYGPGKAANAGGVAVSGLEMSQNSMRIQWNKKEVDSKLKEIIPGAINWPSFEKNLSDQFEARLVQVEIQKTNSILLDNMDGWTLPVASAHGEGYARFENDSLKKLNESSQIALNFVNSDGKKTEIYPINPNGSEEGVTGVTSDDGRVTIMMPHPERVFRKIQMSWHPKHWEEFSPWMQLFINAKKIV